MTNSEIPAATEPEATPAAVKSGVDVIQSYLKHLPNAPGVYRMIDGAGDVIYVGKARSLKARVSNYTRLGGHTNRIARMISATVSMEFVSVRTEAEALLLEANLIKRFRPRFNVLMRDDKSFPYILIARDQTAPQVMKHRGARNAQGRLFRPVRLGRRRQPHHHHAAARVPTAHLLRQRLRNAHAAVPAASDQALLGPVHRSRSVLKTTPNPSTKRCASCAAKARTCARCTNA